MVQPVQPTWSALLGALRQVAAPACLRGRCHGRSPLSTLAAPLQRDDAEAQGGHHGGQQERDADWDAARPYADIPGPRPLPLVGNIWRFIFGELECGKRCAHEMGGKAYQGAFALKRQVAR